MSPMLAPLSIAGLIFGGCCSNVFALEAIVRTEPGSGMLITFFQFLFATCAAYLTQFSTDGRFALKTPRVPVRRWALIAVMFCAVNVLNNWAFAFDVSVPVHIILRSFGSVTTMAAGVIRGKRYSTLQTLSVALLTLGVLVSAWADSEGKGKPMSIETGVPASDFTTGLAILLVAQLLSAYLGAFVEDTYTMYQAQWTENLFYSHLLSLPLFLPWSSGLRGQYARLATTPPLQLKHDVGGSSGQALSAGTVASQIAEAARGALDGMPQGLVFLLANAVTQLACISGVNLLSARSSAVTVTIVLNIRKLVSFMLSTVMFGHRLSPRMAAGAALVFGSGALYGWETSWRLPRERARQARVAKAANGSAGKDE